METINIGSISLSGVYDMYSNEHLQNSFKYKGTELSEI